MPDGTLLKIKRPKKVVVPKKRRNPWAGIVFCSPAFLKIKKAAEKAALKKKIRLHFDAVDLLKDVLDGVLRKKLPKKFAFSPLEGCLLILKVHKDGGPFEHARETHLLYVRCDKKLFALLVWKRGGNWHITTTRRGTVRMSMSREDYHAEKTRVFIRGSLTPEALLKLQKGI